MRCFAGRGGKVTLLRGGMDALPMPKESDIPFACPTGKQAHTCGHDFHAAMLLQIGAAYTAHCAVRWLEEH